MSIQRALLALAAIVVLLLAAACPQQPTQGQGTDVQALGPVELLNVSYDPTRELYEEFNTVFSAHWLEQTGQTVTVTQSHAGSGSQARSVIEGLEADVVTLALGYDIEAISNAGLIAPGWQSRLPLNSSPYTSTIVFLVRSGNPKGIHDWNDLVRPGVSIITPNPKTSGGARWNFLAAWGYALRQPGGSDETATQFVTQLFRNVEVLDSGARGSLTSFSERELGDVLIAWENEALLAINELGADKFEMVVPSVSILAEPPVAIVDTFVDKHGTREVAQAYLEYLYSEEGQEIIARHYYRPTSEAVAARYATVFANIPMFNVNDEFGGWDAAQQRFFADGGIFDQIYQLGT